MSNRDTKQRQLNPQAKPDEIIGSGEFTIPTVFKWTCNKDIVHITTKDRYRGVVTTELPINVIRDILSQIDKVSQIDKADVNDAEKADVNDAEKAVRLKKIIDQIIVCKEDPEILKVLDKKLESIRVQPKVQKSTKSKKPTPKTKSTKRKATIFDLLPPKDSAEM